MNPDGTVDMGCGGCGGRLFRIVRHEMGHMIVLCTTCDGRTTLRVTATINLDKWDGNGGLAAAPREAVR